MIAAAGVAVVSVLALAARRNKGRTLPAPGARETVKEPFVVKGSLPDAPEATWSSLYRRVGTKSRIAGLGFALLTVVFLVLSYYTQFVVFEIDSIVTFLACIILLFSEPRRKVQARLIDAILSSSGKVTAELAATRSEKFEYVPGTGGVSGVTLLPSNAPEASSKGNDGGLPITPPGKALAELFLREAGISRPTFESLEASLPQVVTENFGLANTIKLVRRDDSIKITLGAPSFECPCQSAGLAGKPGVLGCTVGSFFAVLACAAEGRPLELQGCVRDNASDTLELIMRLEGAGGKN